MNKEIKIAKITKGTTVKIGGLPFELLQDVDAIGNLELANELAKPSQSEG